MRPPAGIPPSLPPVKLYSTLSVQPPFEGVSSYTTPAPNFPPWAVMPYRFPAASKISPAQGYDPSMHVEAGQNLSRTFSFQLPFEPGVSWNTTPQPPVQELPSSPPSKVVPYRLPAWSKINPAKGNHPL